MPNHYWSDVDPDLQYDNIESALMSCCYICGDRLEWDLKVEYNSKHDMPIVTGASFSCGIKYLLRYDPDNLCYKIDIHV